MAEIYKQIKDFTLKNSIDGTEDILIQSNGTTMRVKLSQLKNSVDLSNYYTKSEVDNLLANIDVNIDMADYYDKDTIDNLLLNKANVSHTHTSSDITDLSIPTVDVNKAYVDSQLANKSNTNHTHDEYISEAELNEKGYATETYVQTKIAEAATGGTVDLSNYATKTELTTELNKKANLSHTHDTNDINGLNIPTKLSELQNDSGFISEVPSEYINETELNNALANKANTSDIPSLAGYATESFVTNKIAEASLSGGEVDLSGYATKDDLLLKANSTHTHATSDITGLVIPTVDVDKAYVDSQLALKANKSDIQSLTGYATETYVMNKLGGKSLIYLTQSEYDLLSDEEKQDSTKVYNITDAVIDYNELANTPTIPTKTSELNNDSGFITSIPSEYVNETELNTALSNKANTSDIPSLEGYATKSYVDNVITSISSFSKLEILSEEPSQESLFEGRMWIVINNDVSVPVISLQSYEHNSATIKLDTASQNVINGEINTYKIYNNNELLESDVILSGGSTYTITNLTPETSYNIKVKGILNNTYESEFSNIVNFTTKSEPSVVPLPTGDLVLHLRGNDFTNSPSTATLSDLSSSGHDVEAYGFSYTETSGSDREGNIVFDGADDRLSNSNCSIDLSTNSNSFALVFKGSINNLSQASKEIIDFSMTNGASGQQLSVIYGYVTNKIELYGGSIDLRTGSQISINDTNVHTIIYNYDGSKLNCYLDNTKISNVSKSISFTLPIIKFSIGSNSINNKYSNIKMNNVLLYNRSLTESEIELIYNNL